jgi:hypothetical protein
VVVVRSDAWGWVVRSSAAATAAALVLVPMAVLLLLVHGNLWRLGVVTAPWWVGVLLLVAIGPLAAVPGCLTAYVAGQSPRSRRLAATASMLAGLVGGQVVTTSLLGLWVGMVLGALAVVAWRDRVPPRVTVVPRAQAGTGGWRVVEVEELEVRARGPHSRLVPREVLAPPEGWEVPLALPDRQGQPGPRVDEPAERAGR